MTITCTPHAARGMLVAAAALVVGACSVPSIPFYHGPSSLSIQSHTHDGARLSTGFEQAVYSYDGKNSVTVVLYAGPEEAPTQAATVRLLWRPRAGRTPITSQATNATIQYVIFPTAGDEGPVGVYAGAGFLYPRTQPGKPFLEAGIWDATLLLADRSPGFEDRLGKSTLRGDVSARLDDAATQTMIRRLNERITQRLGYPRLVTAE